MQVTEGSGNVLDDLGLTREDMVEVARKRETRIAELEAAVLAAKTMLHPTNDDTEEVWQILDRAYHGNKQ